MSNWKPNAKQQKFLDILSKSVEPMTLDEVSAIMGEEVKSGTTNTLITKKLVKTTDRDIYCDIVVSGTDKVIGHMTKHVKAYSLVD